MLLEFWVCVRETRFRLSNAVALYAWLEGEMVDDCRTAFTKSCELLKSPTEKHSKNLPVSSNLSRLSITGAVAF